jgi:hypothetical protein
MKGFILIRANCKKVRHDTGHWQQIESIQVTTTQKRNSRMGLVRTVWKSSIPRQVKVPLQPLSVTSFCDEC